MNKNKTAERSENDRFNSFKTAERVSSFEMLYFIVNKHKTAVRSENDRFYAFATAERVKVLLTSCISM